MKYFLVGYIILGLGTFIWQLAAYHYMGDCQFNAGACASSVKDYSLNAIVWPAYLLY